MYKKYLSIFILFTFIFSIAQVFAGGNDLDSANKLLADLLTGNDANQIFDPLKIEHYQGANLEQYLFSLFNSGGDINKINYFLNSRIPLVKSKELRMVLFKILNTMIEIQILDNEMIELAKKIIRDKKADAKYFPFEKQEEVINFYNKKYNNNKWVRVNSKTWIYSAAVINLIYKDASKWLTMGQNLKNIELIARSKSLFCALEGFRESQSRCIDAEKTYQSVKSKKEAEDAKKMVEPAAKGEVTKEQSALEIKKQTEIVKLENKGNKSKGRYIFKKKCRTCHNDGEAKKLSPASKKMAEWEEAFKPEKIETYMCKYKIKFLKPNDFNDIYTYLYDFAADSPNPETLGDSIRKVQLVAKKEIEEKKKRQISFQKNGTKKEEGIIKLPEIEIEKEQEITFSKGKTVSLDDENGLAKAAEKISNNYINASMKLGKSLPELGPLKAKKIFETAFSETGYNYNKTLHEFAEKLSDNPMKFLIGMDEQISKILMAFTLPYEEAKTQHIDINQLYKGQALEDIEKIKEIFDSLQKGSNN